MDGDSWADQWDYNGSSQKRGSGGSASATATKYKEKVGEGLEKTKSVAASGFKKVKQGTSLGLNWVKDKYHKTTHKN